MSKDAQAMAKPRHTFLYSFVMALYVVLAKLVFFMRFYGRENIPRDGNYIIMANHVCMLDALTLAMCNLRREIHFMGKKELFNNKFMAWVWTQVHAFPVDRGNMDMGAMRTAMKVLKEGETLGIFPEGTRSRTGEMLPLLSGASVLALRSGVPVIPVYIAGKYRPFRRMRIMVGPAVELTDLRQNGVDKDACDVFTHRLEASFAQLRAQSENF